MESREDPGSRRSSPPLESARALGPAVAALAFLVLAVACTADEPPRTEAAMPVFDVSADSTRLGVPAWPERGGSCYVYRDYVVVAWGSPDPQPVAVVRKRDPSRDDTDCSPDSLPGDFVVRNEWAEYFCGMWRDLLFIDSGTCDIRSLIVYDVTTRRQVALLEGAGETEGWLDDVTVRIWMLASTDAPRSLCPDVPEVLGVGVDSLYALNLEALSLKPLGPWRCRPLQ